MAEFGESVRLYFVINPVAGGRTCLRGFSVVEAILRERGISYATVYTEQPGHAAALTRQAALSRPGCVVAVGGDGTVQEVGQELVHTEIPLGILPFGSGNDLARKLGIPTRPEAALELLLEGRARPVDAMEVNGRFCLNVTGFGLDVDVLERTREYRKRFRGALAYLLATLHAVARRRTYDVTITEEGETVREKALLVAVGNGSYIGGGMGVTPLADVADGLLDVCVVREVRGPKVWLLLAKFMKGKHVGMGFVDYYRTRTLTVECSPEAKVQLDGEIVEKTPVHISVLPAALEVIAGKQIGVSLSLPERTAAPSGRS